MSYEKKMKDLLGRLVAMSPEPPPYPEETPMATTETPRKRPHPALVFAGAVALVAALAVPVILLTGGEGPVAGGTSTTTTSIAPTTTSEPGTSSTTAPSSTSTTSASTTSTTAATAWQGTIFLYQTPENSFLGNPALVPIQVEVTDPSTQLTANDPFTTALAAMGGDLPPGLENAIPPQVQILSIGESTDTIVADMSEAFLDGAGGLLADITMLNQIIYTLTQDDPDKQVEFTVNAQPAEAYGTEGLVLTDPVDRDSFLTELGLIFLIEPIMEVENVYVVAGRSNTFEAILTLRVVDSEGATIHEEP
ncbi:MAG TPA: GerMN domain-containing protein, partial [Acidimicrobiia bacterium]